MKSMYQTQTQSQQKPQQISSFTWKLRRFLNSCRVDKRGRVLRLLHALIKLGCKHQDIFPKQDTLAVAADITRDHCNKLLQEIDRAGLLRIYNRGYDTCLYFLPKEIFFEERQALSSYFPVLRTLGLWLLMSFNSGSKWENITPIYFFTDSSKNIYIHTIERGSVGVQSALESMSGRSSLKKWVVSMSISRINERIGKDLGLTEYGTLLLSCFDDDILVQAYKEFRDYSSTISDSVKWIWKRCKTLSDESNRQIRFQEMTMKVKAAGFEPGTRMCYGEQLIDDESQPRYAQVKKEEVSKKESADKELSAKGSSFLEWVKRNTKVLED